MHIAFLNFLEDLKTNNNSNLLESIEKGFYTVFESAAVYSGEDYFIKKYLGEKKRKVFFSDDIPLRDFNEEEALKEVIEEWKKKGGDLTNTELEFLLSTNPKVTVLGNVINLTKHPAWNMLRKQAGAVFADKIRDLENLKGKELERYAHKKIHGQKLDAPIENIEDIVKKQDMLKKNKFSLMNKNLNKIPSEVEKQEMLKKEKFDMMTKNLQKMAQTELA